MEFMQLASVPGYGIAKTDSYCFGKKMNKDPQPELGKPRYIFRDHPKSNQNSGGWKVAGANKTSFKLILTF
jgi:hypothetical protein